MVRGAALEGFKSSDLLTLRVIGVDAGRKAAERGRERVSERVANLCCEEDVVLSGQEQHDVRAPPVVGRHLGVKAEDIGAGPDECRAVAQFGKPCGERRLDGLMEEGAAEFETWDEGRHDALRYTSMAGLEPIS